MEMDAFQFCHIKQCAVELDSSTIDSTKSIDLDFTRMGFTEDLLILLKEILFDSKTNSLFMCVPTSTASLVMKTATLEPSDRIAPTQPSEPSKRHPWSQSIT